MDERSSLTAAALARSALALAFFACASPESQRSSPSESGPGGPGGPDISSLDVCALLPVADVASALALDEAGGSADLTQGKYATDCTYTFTRDGFSRYAIVWVYPPDLWAPEVREDTEAVSGLGDAAYLTTMGSFAQMHVLVEGELYIDARADTPEQARRLAELALARLMSGRTGP